MLLVFLCELKKIGFFNRDRPNDRSSS